MFFSISPSSYPAMHIHDSALIGRLRAEMPDDVCNVDSAAGWMEKTAHICFTGHMQMMQHEGLVSRIAALP